jgi:branched-chain amino acid transport system permease protein
VNKLNRWPFSRKTNLFYVMLILFLLLIPFFVRNPYILHVLIMLFFYAYLGGAWNILGGYTGQSSFCSAAFFGVGAYTSTLLYIHWGLSPWIGMWLGGVVAVVIGTFIGFLSFRYGIRGIYFVLITLCFGEIVYLIVLNWNIFGGASGILIPLRGNSFSHFQFTSKVPYYYIILSLMLLTAFFTYKLERSRFGDFFIAIREDEDAAEVLGINTTHYKLISMAISCFFMALGGTFYAQYMLYIQQDITLSGTLSIEITFCAIAGGLGTIWGPLIGSSVLTIFSEISRVTLGRYRGMHLMVYGVFVVLIMLYMPQGLLPGLKGAYKKLRGERGKQRDVVSGM